MNREEVVTALLTVARDNGLIATLYGMFGKNVKVIVPFSHQACETSIDDLEFSCRALHSLKRVGVFTIGGVINLIENDGLLKIRNLGRKTENEIKTRVLSFGYDSMSAKEKKRFFNDVLERNCALLV